MSRIKSKNTKPEIITRQILTRLGYRYRLHVGKLEGRPDIVIGRKKIIIFINGCFWHQHKDCKRCTIPKINKRYWAEKLERNVEKQKRDIKTLKRMGWKVYILWECEIKEIEYLYKKLQRIIG